MNKITKLGLSFVAVAFATTSAMAIMDTEFRYTTPKAAFTTINAMSFAPDGFTSGSNYTIFWSTGSLTASAENEGFQCFNTHVTLPASAKLTGIRTYTTSSLDGVFVRFESQQLSTGSSTSIVSTTVGDGSGNRKATFTAIDSSVPVINNTQAYGLGVCLDPGESFSGARIEYNALNAGF